MISVLPGTSLGARLVLGGKFVARYCVIVGLRVRIGCQVDHRADQLFPAVARVARAAGDHVGLMALDADALDQLLARALAATREPGPEPAWPGRRTGRARKQRRRSRKQSTIGTYSTYRLVPIVLACESQSTKCRFPPIRGRRVIGAGSARATPPLSCLPPIKSGAGLAASSNHRTRGHGDVVPPRPFGGYWIARYSGR